MLPVWPRGDIYLSGLLLRVTGKTSESPPTWAADANERNTMDLFSENPTLRKRIYQLFLLLGLALGAIRVGYEATDESVPDLLKALLASYAFLGAGVGGLAASNVHNSEDELPENDDDIL